MDSLKNLSSVNNRTKVVHGTPNQRIKLGYNFFVS